MSYVKLFRQVLLLQVSDKRKWTTEDIMEQLEPMFASLNGAEIPDKERLVKSI